MATRRIQLSKIENGLDSQPRKASQNLRDFGGSEFFDRDEAYQEDRHREERFRRIQYETDREERRDYNRELKRERGPGKQDQRGIREDQKRKGDYQEDFQGNNMEEGEWYQERGYKRSQLMNEDKFMEDDER